MEGFWYVLSSALAGVGTGLAGLSAATVMVPILITRAQQLSQTEQELVDYLHQTIQRRHQSSQPLYIC